VSVVYDFEGTGGCRVAGVEMAGSQNLPMMSGSRDRGTATSVDHTSRPSVRSASMLQSDSLRADQSVFCSWASMANSKSPLLWARAIDLTRWTFSRTCTCQCAFRASCSGCYDEELLTPAWVPENLWFRLLAYIHINQLEPSGVGGN
jgi:hypothetical protein